MKRLASLILVAVLIVLPGCGSSSSSSSTSATDGAASGEGSLTKAEFIAKADVLCEASKAKGESLRTKIEEVAQKARGEEQSKGGVADSTRHELALTLIQIGAIGEDSLAKIDGIERPEADANQLKAIFKKVESAFESSRAYGVALDAHQDARAQAIAEKGDAETRETASLARQYGFKVCGSRP